MLLTLSMTLFTATSILVVKEPWQVLCYLPITCNKCWDQQKVCKMTSILFLGIATGMVKPTVFPKQVMWVQLPNLDTTHNCVQLWTTKAHIFSSA